MEDTSNNAAYNDLWAQYSLAFTQAAEIVQKMGKEADHNKRAELRKTLRSLDAQRVQLLDQIDATTGRR
jgi:hypothetical protein